MAGLLVYGSVDQMVVWLVAEMAVPKVGAMASQTVDEMAALMADLSDAVSADEMAVLMVGWKVDLSAVLLAEETQQHSPPHTQCRSST